MNPPGPAPETPDAAAPPAPAEAVARPLRLRTVAAITLAGAALLWAVFSWPLPRHMMDGIPSSSQNIETGSVRRMIPGDHLQLLYHFWLFSDMAAGRTPWFNNLYEFNAGDDAAGYRVRPYYLPWSGVYAAFAAAGGRAFGWNLTQMFSLWLTWLLTWLLVRRYTPDEFPAAVFSLLGVLLPFRWVTLFGGSPSGFAMTWVPAVWLGIDRAVRDGRWTGGLLAGLALMFASWNDKHGVFFCTLSAPAWTLFALLHSPGFRWTSPATWRVPILALLPAAVGGLPAVMQTWLRGKHLEASAHEMIRSVDQIGMFTPDAGGFFRWAAEGASSHAYIGYTPLLLILVGLGGLVLGWGFGRHAARRGLFTATLAAAAAAGIAMLALGPRGPAAGLAYRAACKVLPPYRMIRQPGKAFILMPTLMALAAGAAAGGLRGWTGGPASRRWFVAAFGLVMCLEMKHQVRATVSLLDNDQAAYRAAAEEARARGAVPRVVVVPLWPGDSALASSYEHYASLERLRLVNGYSPAVPRKYVAGVYERLRALNHGELGDEELAALREMGVTSLLLHEDLFPEKVSPFPVGVTLQRLLAHPALRWLKQDGRVWAFAIVDPAQDVRHSVAPSPRHASSPELLCVARTTEFESASPGTDVAREDRACSGGAFARWSPGVTARLARARSYAVAGARWEVRARGNGRTEAVWQYEDQPAGAAMDFEVRGPDWSWIAVHHPPPPGKGSPSLRLICLEGSVDADVALFMGPGWTPPAPGETKRLPPASFFRAGYSRVESGAVVFERDRDPDGRIFYGPNLPLPAGRYRTALSFASPAPAGTRLGIWRAGPATNAATDVVAGRTPATVEFIQPADLPFVLSFDFLRAADIELTDVALTRVE